MAGPIRAIHHWQKLCETEPARIDPVFGIFPKAFLQLCSQPGTLHRYNLIECLKIIKRSPWSNELALILISVILNQKPPGSRFTKPLEVLKYCSMFLKQCSKAAGGKDKLQHDYHMKTSYWFSKGDDLPTGFLKDIYPAFIDALQTVEIVLSNLPTHEQRALTPYQFDIHSEEVFEGLGPNTLDALRPHLPEVMQNLRGTALEPGWTGSAPGRRVLGVICSHLDSEFSSWTSILAAYALIRSAQGASQDVLLEHLTEASSYLNSWQEWVVGNFAWPQPQPPEPIKHIVRTLARRPEPVLHRLAECVRHTTRMIGADQTMPKVRGWAGVLGETPIEQALIRLIDSQPDLQSLDEFQLQATSYLSKWRGRPYFLHLVLLTIGLAANREHRPASAMRTIRGLRHLLSYVAIRLEGEVEPPLETSLIRRVLEDCSRDNLKATRKLQNLAASYRGAWQSQQTFLARTDTFSAALNGLLLPHLGGGLDFPRVVDSAHLLRQQERQEDIDLVADHWTAVHRCANANFVAIRAVMLAFRTATWSLSPRQVKAAIPLDVPIPGRGETWHFQIWTPRLFSVHVGAETSGIEEEFFLEYRGVTGSSGAEGLWCAALFQAWLDPEAASQFEATLGRPLNWLRPNNLGVLNLGHSLSWYFRSAFRILRAKGRPLPCVFAPDAVYRTAIFGALSFRLSREGAHRAHELLQLRYEEEFLSEETIDGRPWRFMQVLPKGRKGTRSRPAKPAFKVVSDAADRALDANYHLHQMLGEPDMAVLKVDGTAEERGHFAFRTNQTVISTQSINVCLRFLVYSAFRDIERVPNVTAHVLRHAFAKNARKAGVSVEKVALVLNHADLLTSQRYARPTYKDQLETLAQVAEKTGMWAPTVPHVEGGPLTVSPVVQAPGLSGMTEEEFEQWLATTELEFEEQEWMLIAQMEGVNE